MTSHRAPSLFHKASTNFALPESLRKDDDHRVKRQKLDGKFDGGTKSFPSKYYAGSAGPSSELSSRKAI